jgi:hypothetical protein
MPSEQHEKVCLFCLEPKKGRRNHRAIEFKGLFSCACIFQSHAECIIKWQLHCLDEIQCPICRVHLIVDSSQTVNQPVAVAAVVENDPTGEIGKKFVFIGFVYVISVLIIFTLVGIRL